MKKAIVIISVCVICVIIMLNGVSFISSPEQKIAWEVQTNWRGVTNTNGKERWKAIHRKKLINRSDIEILSKYNSEVRGLANYYSLACNPIRMAHFSSLMKYSMLKTFVAKYRTKTSKIKARYLKKGIFTVPYMTKAGPKECVYYNEGFERRKEPLFGQVDMQATYKKYAKPSSLICKLRAKTCELCGTTCDDIEIHQVKRLKDLTGNAEWEQVMRSRHRKTLAVCPNCHEMIHRSNKSQDDGKRRAVCAERCLHGSGGSQ